MSRLRTVPKAILTDGTKNLGEKIGKGTEPLKKTPLLLRMKPVEDFLGDQGGVATDAVFDGV